MVSGLDLVINSKNMKKIALFIFILLLIGIVLIGAGCGEENKLNEDEEKTEERKGGSCNGIEVDSTCVDYTGSWWTESSCTEEGYYYSPEPCPQPTAGGCKQRPNTANEKIIWSYNYGGRPLTWKSEVEDVLKPSCTQHPYIEGQWISGSIELK